MEDNSVSLPNVGICLDKLKAYMEATKDGSKASTEDFTKADQALKYLYFLLGGKPEWNWVNCGITKPVIR